VFRFAVAVSASESKMILNLTKFTARHAQVPHELTGRIANKPFCDQRGRLLCRSANLRSEFLVV
jgi:hypothetical protein